MPFLDRVSVESLQFMPVPGWQFHLYTSRGKCAFQRLAEAKMSILSNFKIRTKILIALLPLVVMVAAAGIYSSIEMKKIDTQYSELMDRDLGALQAITFAQSTNNRFNLFLYKEIAETNPDQIRVVDAGVDSAVD